MMRTPVHSLDPRAQRGVILAHPGTQYSYETAFALQEAGLLQCYMTGFYFKPENSLGRALRLLPNGRGTELEREFRRRFKPELAPQNVRTYPAAELIYVVSSRLRPLRPFSEAILRWRNKCFDGWVAKRIARERPKAVVCYDSCAQRTFEGAKSLGTLCVLDQSIGHICTGLQLLREEAKLHPDFADSLPRRSRSG